MNDHSTQNEYASPLEYSYLFTARPFGLTFKNRNSTGALTETDVFVSKVNKDCAANGNVILGSQLIKIQNQSVEGLNPKRIMSIFSVTYHDVLPLLMTFRKPLTRRLSLNKGHALKNNINFECNSRSMFLDVDGFYKIWRSLSSETLLNALLLMTSDEYSRLIKSQKPPAADDIPMAKDSVFKNLLQWKKEQGLLLIVDREKKGKKSTFWQRFSEKLVQLVDPSTYNTAKYSALKLDINEYEKLDSFKHAESLKDIANELVSAKLNVCAIQEILYRSKVWLNVYDQNGINITLDEEISRQSSFDQEVDAILDEIADVWEESGDSHYME